METLEPNMYVRTKEGTIEKIIDKYEAPYGYKVVVNEDFRFKHYEHNYIKHIVKASHNIIDLIEVGDYVNGHKVFLVKENSIRIEEREQTWGVMEIETIDIKTIVTKQQFESMQYEVK